MAKYIVVHSIRVAKDFVPETFGRFTTIGPKFRMSSPGQLQRTYQVCQCSCGTIKVVGTANIKYGNTESCGCRFREAVAESNTKHGMFGTVEHDTWNRMIQRCENTNCASYCDYGGRGIAVCPEWRDPDTGFQTFFDFVGIRPSPKHSLERKRVNGNYEPGNVRWATAKEQARNRRNNVELEYGGKKQCVAAWAEDLGICPGTIYSRLLRGWSVEKTLTFPVHKEKGIRNK